MACTDRTGKEQEPNLPGSPNFQDLNRKFSFRGRSLRADSWLNGAPPDRAIISKDWAFLNSPDLVRNPAKRALIIFSCSAPSVRAEISFGLHKGSRPLQHIPKSSKKMRRRDGLDQKLADACIA